MCGPAQPAQHCAGPCQPAASPRQSRQGGEHGAPELATHHPASLHRPGRRCAAWIVFWSSPRPRRHPIRSPWLSLALSPARPNTTVAAVRHSHRLRPPLAPPTSSGAPPRLPLPPHRSTAPRKPCIAATSPFPSSGSDHRRRRIRRLQRVPEPASTPTATAVSYATVSPSSSPRSLTVAASPPRPNLRRRRARRRRSSGDHLVTPASPTRSQNPVEHP